MTSRSEVLVALMPDLLDMKIAREQHWYRIPSASINPQLRRRWPPQWVAFYQPKIFAREGCAVNYFARVENICQVCRWQLFPDAPQDKKRYKHYYKLQLSPLERLSQPIKSRRARPIVFIQTTWEKLINAVEINDLYDDSPLEDRLWAELKNLQIDAERQVFLKVKNNTYALDFAIYCDKGNINVETDGDTWHADKTRIPQDNRRDNDLQNKGWYGLRFNTQQIQEQMQEYCLPTILEAINRLGGLKQEKRIMPRLIDLDEPQWQQLTLF